MTRNRQTALLVTALAASGLLAALWIVYIDSPLFTERDLPGMVLQEEEAPEGMQFVESESGPVEVSDLTASEAAQAALEQDGFLAAHDAIFASPGVAGVPGEVIGNEAGIVDSSVFVFDSIEGSIANFERLRTEVPSSFGPRATLFPIVAEDLGDESLALRIEFSNTANGPDVAIIYVWRIENSILRIVRWGEIVDETEDVRPMVDLINNRLDR